MIRDRLLAGRDRARSSGNRLGRPRTTPSEVQRIRALDGRGVGETERLLKVSAAKVSEGACRQARRDDRSPYYGFAATARNRHTKVGIQAVAVSSPIGQALPPSSASQPSLVLLCCKGGVSGNGSGSLTARPRGQDHVRQHQKIQRETRFSGAPCQTRAGGLRAHDATNPGVPGLLSA